MSADRWLNRDVWGMTLTSLFADACYEMVFAVLPGFVPLIGLSAAGLGWIEGAADAISGFLKLGSGWYSDRLTKRKPLVTTGYALTGTGLSLFTLAHSWVLIFAGRLVSWFGKGIRGPLRDSMLTESVPPEARGRAFGFHRAGDTVGAIVGPLAGVWLIGVLPRTTPDHPFRVLFALSLIPGLLSPLCFALFVRERARTAGNARGLWVSVRELPRNYGRFLTAAAVYGAGDFAPTLLVLAAVTLVGKTHGPLQAARIGALLYLLRNVAYALASYPLGALSDRLRGTRIVAAGCAAGAASSALIAWMFASDSTQLGLLAIPFVLSGVFAAALDAVGSSTAAGFASPHNRGTVLGVYSGVNAVGDLVASALIGSLWSGASPQVAFAVSAVLLAAGGLMIAVLRYS